MITNFYSLITVPVTVQYIIHVGTLKPNATYFAFRNVVDKASDKKKCLCTCSLSTNVHISMYYVFTLIWQRWTHIDEKWHMCMYICVFIIVTLYKLHWDTLFVISNPTCTMKLVSRLSKCHFEGCIKMLEQGLQSANLKYFSTCKVWLTCGSQVRIAVRA